MLKRADKKKPHTKNNQKGVDMESLKILKRGNHESTNNDLHCTETNHKDRAT